MSGATTKNVTDSTTVTKQEIRSRLREMMKQVQLLKKFNVGLSTDPYRLLLKEGEHFVDVAAVKTDPVIHAYVRRFRPKPKECFYNGQWFVVFDGTGPPVQNPAQIELFLGPSRVPVFFLTVDDQSYAVSEQLVPF